MKERKRYPTDLTDEEWSLIEPTLPVAKTGRPRKYSQREMFNAIAYVTRTGCSWRMLPHDLPPWQAVYGYFRQMQTRAAWSRLNDKLRRELRLELGREAEPSVVIVDSQSVKTTEKGDLVAMTAANGSKVANDKSRLIPMAF